MTLEEIFSCTFHFLPSWRPRGDRLLHTNTHQAISLHTQKAHTYRTECKKKKILFDLEEEKTVHKRVNEKKTKTRNGEENTTKLVQAWRRNRAKKSEENIKSYGWNKQKINFFHTESERKPDASPSRRSTHFGARAADQFYAAEIFFYFLLLLFFSF